VWDYAGDGYVHRLIQNKADGKLVELPSASMGSSSGDGMGPSSKDALSAEKIEAIGIEYSYLLTSQLDSQREWYEQQTAGLRQEIDKMRISLEQTERMANERLEARLREERIAKEEEKQYTEIVEREKVRAIQKAEKMSELARKLEKELKEERAVSEGLFKNLGKMKEKAEAAEREKQGFEDRIKDLEDQVRDVMFFLEAKTKIEEGNGVVGEAAGGSLELPPTPKANGKKKKSKK
jgi:BRCA1-associated protein